MRAAFYWWRATRRSTWRSALVVALIAGLLGTVSLAALAGARRTASAYGRYLAATRASDAFVNVPGAVPGIPLTEPLTLISRLPGVTAGAGYIGLDANPVVRGRVVDSFQTDSLTGSYAGPSFTADGFGQDRMTVLAGRLPVAGSAGQMALTPLIARLFGVGVGGRVTYQFYRQNPTTYQTYPDGRHTFLVTAIVEIPPVLVDQADQKEGGFLPPGATRRLLSSYEYAWVGVRLARGPAGIPQLQQHLAALAISVQRRVLRQTHQRLPGLVFNIARSDIIQDEVQQAIRPQAVALAAFGVIAALAMLVLTGQGVAQMLSRPRPDIAAARALGATRIQAATAIGLQAGAAVVAGMILAVAGAVALSPLAPVGPVRQFDPARGAEADGLVLGAGSAALTVVLLGLLAVMAARASAPRPAGGQAHPSAIARAVARAGLGPTAVVGSRNALEPGSGAARAVPAWSTLLGSVAAVTAVTAVAVFGASLSGLITHPVRYGWNWDVLLQAEGGYGNWQPSVMSRLVDRQPAVAAWSSFAFSQVPIDSVVVPVLGLERDRGSVEPPTTSGRPLSGDDQIELGTVTMRQLGKHIGDTVVLGARPYRRSFTIVGTVTLPSFGVALTDHVSLGRGALLSERALLAVQGTPNANAQSPGDASQSLPSAVAIDLVPGTSAAQRARMVRQITSANPDGTPGGTYEMGGHLANAIVNAAKMGDQPLALALGVAAAAVLSLALTVLASVRRQRREYALLKSMGMTRGQVRAIVAWQISIVLTVAAVIGVPLGVTVGRWTWTGFADSLGVVPFTQIPLLALLLGFAVLLLAGNLLAAGPARIAARTSPAVILRTE
ncbi:MAG TPA: FtsX-like permease family protein [Streptosporangiaceae bacterium]|nr:FtsX-like permease family protein [Streptosporangiaceae bacterium]